MSVPYISELYGYGKTKEGARASLGKCLFYHFKRTLSKDSNGRYILKGKKYNFKITFSEQNDFWQARFDSITGPWVY